MLIVSDIHEGVTRASGTTLKSAAELSLWLHESFEKILMAHLDQDLCILGDLFDRFTVDHATLWRVYTTLYGWLQKSKGDLALVQGNHDWSAKGEMVSSFHLLSRVLQSHFGLRVELFDSPGQMGSGVWVIPHVANQDIFNMHLAEVSKLENHTILLHANYNNPFTEHSDHSLNVSEEVARQLTAGGNKLLFAHEHQHRTALGGRVVCLGNQIPSSVADCLAKGEAQRDGKKYAWILGEDQSLTPIETWSNEGGGFVQVDWRELNGADAKFVRVCGDASSAEAAGVVSAIAKFRQKSSAFVVTNAVKIEGIAEMGDLPESFEDAKKFDVLGFLMENLDPEEQEVVRQVLAAE